MSRLQSFPFRREAGEKLAYTAREGTTGTSLFSPCPRFLGPRPEQLPRILCEWGTLIAIWEAEQGDGPEQPLLLFLLSPKQVLPLEGRARDQGIVEVMAGRQRGPHGRQASFVDLGQFDDKPSCWHSGSECASNQPSPQKLHSGAGCTPRLKEPLLGQIYMSPS